MKRSSCFIRFLCVIIFFCFHQGKCDTVATVGIPPHLLLGAPPIQYSTLSGPSFVANASTSPSPVLAGTTALLSCAVRNLHNFTVSWVRGKDIQLLTTAQITYTSDKRFVSVNPSGGEQWILKIHYAKKSDSGSYLCQVSTTPPITKIFDLEVREAVLRVLPGKEVYVQTGSRLEFLCQVEGCSSSSLLSWSKNGKPISGTQLATSSMESSHSQANLTFVRERASAEHSGVYTCTSSCTQPTDISVHVLRGEELAAMQHHNGTPSFLSLRQQNYLKMAFVVCVFLLLLGHLW